MTDKPHACIVSKFTRVIVTGCRHSYWIETATRAVANLSQRHEGLVIVHGGAQGIDTAFADACREAQVMVECFPAQWENIEHPHARIKSRLDGTLYNAAAGPIRNQDMITAGAVMCLAFHPKLESSKGTKDCVKRALQAGIPTWWKASDHAEDKPRRLRLSSTRGGWEVVG